jgi:hypothetical protein
VEWEEAAFILSVLDLDLMNAQRWILVPEFATQLGFL